MLQYTSLESRADLPKIFGVHGKIFGVHGVQHPIFYPRGAVEYNLEVHISTNPNTGWKYNASFYSCITNIKNFMKSIIINSRVIS